MEVGYGHYSETGECQQPTKCWRCHQYGLQRGNGFACFVCYTHHLQLRWQSPTTYPEPSLYNRRDCPSSREGTIMEAKEKQATSIGIK